VERWEQGRLRASFLVTRYEKDKVSLKEALIYHYREDPCCARLMDLLQLVALAIRRMHDAGVVHRDLGNQNILLSRTGPGQWADPRFIDLNRARLCMPLSMRQRAFDFSRLHLPSDLLRILMEMYFDGPIPDACRKWRRFYRSRFRAHARTRAFRHPIRTRRERASQRGGLGTPAPCDIWLWDDRSGQAISTMRRRERARHRPAWQFPSMLVACLQAAVPVWLKYRTKLGHAYGGSVAMKDRVGMAVEPRPEIWEQERALLDELGCRQVLLRFYHHTPEADWSFRVGVVEELVAAGYGVAVVLVQDRNAVMNPDRWHEFARFVVSRVGEKVRWVQIGVAINRVKWGCWSMDDYAALAAEATRLSDEFPDVAWVGPAVIDFEYHYLLGVLKRLPEGIRLGALAHLLYVDRRGAPENKQDAFSTLEKAALARAIAAYSPRCDDRLIVSETNWPLRGTGVYSPICSPYLYTGQDVRGGVDEETYGHYMIRYLLITLCSGLVDQVYWWRLVARGFGLIDDTDADAWRTRPSCRMLKVFLSCVAEATFVRLLQPEPGAHIYEFKDQYGVPFALAYSSGGPLSCAPPFPCASARDACGHDVDGPGEVLHLTGAPLYLFGATT